MFGKPQQEHEWLHKMIGEWNVEAECETKPGEPLSKMTSKLTCNSIGGMWIQGEGSGDCPEGGPWKTVITLGYDPAQNAYVGTFVGSMMSNLWVYKGTRDEAGRRLVLDARGPKMDGTGMADYQDIVEIIDDNHWVLSSQVRTDDGKWHAFMWSHHRR
jgi:hypothetical protein